MNSGFQAFLDEMNIVTVLISKNHSSIDLPIFTLYDGAEESLLKIDTTEEFDVFYKFRCQTKEDLALEKQYQVINDLGERTDLLIGSVMRTVKFDSLYFYDGNDLGANYSQEQTLFKVWAPTASSVTLLTYSRNGLLNNVIEMEREDRGVWSTLQKGDMEGTYYTYNVCVNQIWREAVDPYVKAVSVNGQFGVVVDLEKTKVADQSAHLPKFSSPTEAIIYETHIRDFSIHPQSGIRHKGKYLAFTEENTSGPEGCKTGIDYIQELGITHLELLPFNDYGGVDEAAEGESEYNWGYNPIHYNAPEGSYSMNPYDPYLRVKEVKEMVETLHRKGIRVIMDVVYNHVYIREQSAFWKIVPGYYFRYDKYGLPSDGTGVGNDIASERRMVRKFIIDSVTYWAKEYNIDGFRFDLMGILDVETMNEIRAALDQIKSDILIIGEGWNLNTPIDDAKKATIENASILPRIAHFNDQFRDGVKGNIFNLQERGFALGNDTKKDLMKYLFSGSISLDEKAGMFPSPAQSVNYIECHDNHTLFDKLYVSNGEETVQQRMKRQKLATAMLLFSQGIPFLHSGMEFFRTKYGEGNSFNLPDEINQLDWARKSKYEKDVLYISTLIKLRKAHPAFQLATTNEIRKHYKWLHTPPYVAGFMLDELEGLDPWVTIAVYFNISTTDIRVSLEQKGSWSVSVYDQEASLESIAEIEGELCIPALATVVLFRGK
ncbi:type I pullulanase [Bacillus sp. Marseille-P3661]|uniref:type I pullulanase n=1 Tax=Bacillus sp. Marseille-P3661 TaxID=1936234 RepID=UPI000C83D71C|nr:type I pullulanase [Bacillus sp. Marseille-P3661]